MSTRTDRSPSQSDLRKGRPLWLDHHSRREYPALHGHCATDVAVIGGGLTGVLTALRLAHAGASVALLEAQQIGRGSTGASSALLIHEPDRGFRSLAARYGPASAARIWTLAQGAVGDLIGTLEAYHVRCDLTERDALYLASTPDAASGLRKEFNVRRHAGFPMSWLTANELHTRTGIAGAAGVLTRHNAQCDPYKACTGLARAAARAGVAIFERSKVTSVHERNGGVRVRTAGGCVEAGTVIVATGYATPVFRPLVGRFRMYDTYVMATPPLDRAARRRVGIGNVLMWDTERPYHYLRWTADHRLLLGGGDRRARGHRVTDAHVKQVTARLLDEFTHLLPSLAGVPIERTWHGLFALTPDSLPLVGAHRRYPHHLFALGYGGNGMTFAALAARMLVEQWRGVKTADHDLFRFGRF